MKYIILGLLFVSSSSCATCRGVVGASYRNSDNIVDFVYPNSPAEQSGIVPGDELLFPDTYVGSVGSKQYIRWITNGPNDNRIVMEDTVTRVCVDNLQWSKSK